MVLSGSSLGPFEPKVHIPRMYKKIVFDEPQINIPDDGGVYRDERLQSARETASGIQDGSSRTNCDVGQTTLRFS